jgi:hypothetical protein
MTVQDVIERRKIQEVLHFTTNLGLTGILATKTVIPRKQLPEEQYLEHIVFYNCENRSRDENWLGYVNLSLTTVNLRLFGISRGKWHKGVDAWWCILSFSPEILSHKGVVFATTNNIYTGVKRGVGESGLEKLFADKVERWTGEVAERTESTPINQPTCNQAEVLYPGPLSTDYLRHVYVEDDEYACAVESFFDTFEGLPVLDCQVKPELFS